MNQRRQLFFIISLAYLAGHFAIDNWKTRTFGGDSCGYYLHVVSFFVHDDVGDYDKTIASLKETFPRAVDPRDDKFGVRLTEKGRRYIKYTLGVGMMETPFFLLAHAYASYSDKYKANGWSLPYMAMVNISIVFYVIAGFYLLLVTLEKYFPERIIVYTLLAIGFATNLFYQATFATMAHGFLFFDLCLLLWLTMRFYENPTRQKAVGIGLTVGLITITRVPEIVSVFVPLLWGVYNWQTFKNRLDFFKQNGSYLLFALVGFIIIFFPQIIYWEYVSGHIIFNPYQGEGFNFWKPNIYNGWFHFKNGWLVYTPIMAFSLIGWFLLKRYCRVVQLAVFSFVVLNAWIHYSYYIWNYFPGLGSRPMVETYPLLAFGLAAFFSFCQERNWTKWLSILLVVFFSWLNLFQTWQCKEGIIWTQHSNAAFYWETFGALNPNKKSLIAYDSKEFQPDSANLQFLKTIAFERFEDSTRFTVSSAEQYSGEFSLADYTKFPNCGMEMTLKDFNIKSRDWIFVSIKSFRRRVDAVKHRNHLELLVVELFDERNKLKKWTHIKFARQTGNKSNSIWYPGATNQWADGGFFVRIPWKATPDWRLKINVQNPHHQKIFLDDLRIEHYR